MTRILKADARAAEECAGYLRAGEIIVYPTETVYGMGADAANGAAVEKAFLAKRRERGRTMSVAVGSVAAAREIAEFGPEAEAIARAFLPGPVTLILRSKVALARSEIGSTIGIRVPDNGFFVEMWRRFGRPIISTSANLSGRPDPVRAEDVDRSVLSGVAALVDGGPTKYRRPSTVVEISGGRVRIAREGAIPSADIGRSVNME